MRRELCLWREKTTSRNTQESRTDGSLSPKKGLIDVRTATVVAVSVVALLLLAGSVMAEPSLNGYTGLLRLPTADVQPAQTYAVGVTSSELQDWDDFGYYGTFGIGSQTEAGLMLWRDDDSAGNATFLHLKRALSDEGERPQIAAGIFDLGDDIETTVYLVASWAQGNVVGEVDGRTVRFLNLHAGFGAGQIQDFFFGADVRLGENLIVMGEFVDDDVNLGVRLSPSPGFTVDAGLMDVDDLAVNVSYTGNL